MEDIIKDIFADNDFIDKKESFLSEKDLQFSLALMLKKKFETVILEYPLAEEKDNKNKYKYVDIYCKDNKKGDEVEYFIELKYKTKECKNVTRFKIKKLNLQGHGAYYDNRFYIYQDIAKLEDIVLKRKNCKGYVLFLTNDEKYQSEKNKKFPLHDKIINNKYEHRSIDNPMLIRNSYTLEWKKFPPNENFKYVLIKIPFENEQKKQRAKHQNSDDIKK